MPPKRIGIQLAEPFSESRLLNKGRYHTTWTPPYALQRKLDGDRCRALVSDGRCLLLSSTEEIISSVPHINSAFIHSFPNGEYDGELYKHGWTHSEINSVVSRTTNMHPKFDQVEFHLFDIKNGTSQAERISHCLHLPYNNYIKHVPVNIAFTLTEVMAYYDQYIAEGYEGFIIRELSSYYVEKRSQLMMKFKPKKSDTYPIFSINDAISETGSPLGMVGSFWCVDDMGTTFKVGAGKLTHPERKRLWEVWLDGALPKNARLYIEYQTMSDAKKVPLFSRAVKII